MTASPNGRMLTMALNPRAHKPPSPATGLSANVACNRHNSHHDTILSHSSTTSFPTFNLLDLLLYFPFFPQHTDSREAPECIIRVTPFIPGVCLKLTQWSKMDLSITASTCTSSPEVC